jgi:hypothetical protein
MGLPLPNRRPRDANSCNPPSFPHCTPHPTPNPTPNPNPNPTPFATPTPTLHPIPPLLQLVEELLTFWSLEDYETTLEELEEVLIVSGGAPGRGPARCRGRGQGGEGGARAAV